MSLKVLNWAWTITVPPAPKLVLMALADEADDSGFCFPSQGRIARKCSITDRSVRRLIGKLVALRHVAIEQRFNRNRGRTSNGYQLLCEPPRTDCPGGLDAGFRGTRTTLSGGIGQCCPGAPDSAVRVTTTYPRSYPNTPPLPGADKHRSAVLQAEQGVDSGGLEYPNALSPAQRRAVASHVSRIVNEQAQQVLDELAGRMATTQVRNPVRYCAQLVKRLEQGKFTAELGLAIAERRAARQQAAYGRSLNGAASREQANRCMSTLPEALRKPLERISEHTATRAPSVEPGGDIGFGKDAPSGAS